MSTDRQLALDFGNGATQLDPPSPSIAPKDVRASNLFIHIAFISCLCMQRFGIVTGNSVLFLSLPVTIGLVGWMLVTGRGRLDSNKMIFFLVLMASVAISTVCAAAFPDLRVSLSLLSALAMLPNYMIFLVRPTERFDASRTFEIFIKYARLCAILGIAQYLLQYIGIMLFSFSIMFPWMKPILIESAVNFDPVISYGSIYRRANGFFLLEPSFFSQIIVIAVCVDFFIFRRYRFLPVYGLAYMFSHAGTGLLCLLMALPPFMILFYRQASRLLIFGALGICLVGMIALVLPDQFSALSHRSGELSSTHSSGYARYVGQFKVVDIIIDEPRALIGYGPGATERASFFIKGSAGAIQKLIVDYGVFGLLSFFAFYIYATWRNDISIVPLLLLSIFLFGGGNLFSSFFIALVAILCVWSGAMAPERRRSVPDARTFSGASPVTAV